VGKQKTALVLSAGGMFGAYQAGAYRAISEQFEPDLVVGASVGALNGWSIAGGGTAEHLIERWRDPATGEVLRLHTEKRFRFDPEPLRRHAEELYRQFKPRIRFGLVVVKLKGLADYLIEHPKVTAEHLRATASIPICLPTVRIGENRYLDGGVLEKLPVWAAVEMGATRIIAVDCLQVSNWWIRSGIRAFRGLKARRRLPAGLDITLITPGGPLGAWDDAVFWKRDNIERWIDLGARDASRALAEQLSFH
jgi:NTE family protein